ncbi:DUF1343 domain-containing protein [candidate division KSB1 bacterium]|nr:DUF1343 domain-containing protein [candidate division KSB1 bacterium]
MKALKPLNNLIFFLLLLACAQPHEDVMTGLDLLHKDDFKVLQGKRVGLITNHTAIDHQKRHAADLLNEHIDLVALYAPEHGIRGQSEAGERIESGVDPVTGIPLYSLYGKTRKPTPDMLKGVEALVFDIQDIGTRFYTYISTLYHCMQAAAEQNIPFYILDRPNPISGAIVEGPVLDLEFQSFVGIHKIPLRHGMTVGELAQMFAGEGWIGSDSVVLTVIPVQNWKRDMFFDETGLPWVKPSPNIIDLQTALVYPGTGLLEGTNVSEGRGTMQPFRLFGAPWISAEQLQSHLEQFSLKGVTIQDTSFTPTSLPGMSTHPKYLDQPCSGIFLTVNEMSDWRAVDFGIHLLCSLRDLYPDSVKIKATWLNKLLGTNEITERIINGESANEIISSWSLELTAFMQKREPYLLYPPLGE